MRHRAALSVVVPLSRLIVNSLLQCRQLLRPWKSVGDCGSEGGRERGGTWNSSAETGGSDCGSGGASPCARGSPVALLSVALRDTSRRKAPTPEEYSRPRPCRSGAHMVSWGVGVRDLARSMSLNGALGLLH